MNMVRDMGCIQLFQVTVRNVMTAPIWDSIELNTVRELHVVRFFKLTQPLSALHLRL